MSRLRPCSTLIPRPTCQIKDPPSETNTKAAGFPACDAYQLSVTCSNMFKPLHPSYTYIRAASTYTSKPLPPVTVEHVLSSAAVAA